MPPAPDCGLCLPCTVVKVVDGDTVDVRLLPPVLRVRLLACWAKEIHGAEKAEGLAAKQFLESLCSKELPSKVFLPITGSGRLADLLTLDRVLGRLFVADQDVSQTMVAHGLATPFKPPVIPNK